VGELSDYSAMPRAKATHLAAVSGHELARENPNPALLSARAPSWSRVMVACGECALAGGSLFLAAWLLALPQGLFDQFVSGNVLVPSERTPLLLQLFAAALLPAGAAALVALRYKAEGARWVVRAGELAAPLSLSCFIPNLLNFRRWYSHPLPYLVQLLLVVLLLERLLTRAFASSRLVPPIASSAERRSAKLIPLGIVLLMAAGYSAYMSYYTIMRHQMLGTAGFDLGIFDNLMVNGLHGRPFRSTVAVPHGSYLSNHAEYGMFLFLPIYAIWPGSETLLVLQSLSLGFSALPLYLFGCTQLSRRSACALACASLLYAPLHGPNFYDFHWLPMAMFFFYWLFYAIVKRNIAWIAVLTAVICSVREDTALGTIVIGMFLIVTGYWPRLGAILSAVSTVWFVLVKFVIMPWAGPWWFADIYKDLMAPGERGYGSVVKTALINPNYFLKTLLTESKLIYTLHMLAPLALLPIRHWALGLLFLPGFIVTLMTTGYAPTLSIAFQYTTTFIPFLFGASAIALRLRAERLGLGARRASLLALCLGVLCHSYVFGAIFQHNTFVGGFSRVFFEMSKGERRRYADLREVAARIPPDASVAATELEIPHVSARLDAYTLKVTDGDAQFLFLNKEHFDGEARQIVRRAFKKQPYCVLANKGEFYLLVKQGHKLYAQCDAPKSDAALRTLGLHNARK
jgi:uncharacterized membrane protein